MVMQVLADIGDDKELTGRTRRWLSLAFLSIAAILSLLEYTRPFTGWHWGFIPSHLWPWSEKPHTVVFRPDFINGMIGLALVTPLYLRGILKWKQSIYSIISFSLILLIVSSFVTMALGGGHNGTGFVREALISAVALSWLGMRSVAGISWLVALASGIYTVNANSIAMGLPGFVYVASATLGLLLHSGLGPGHLVQSLMLEYWPASRRALEASRSDVGALGENVGRLAQTASRMALPGS